MRRWHFLQAVRETRVWSVLQTFGRSVFLTLTTPDVVSLATIRERWRRFRHDYFRSLGEKRLRWVMCFEPHPQGHGWHVHVVIDCSFLPIGDIRRYALASGFGRVHIEAVFGRDRMADYVSKYVCKVEKRMREKGCRRVRLVNVSRGLTRLSDIEVKSPVVDYCRKCVETPIVAPVGRLNALGRWKLAEAYLIFGRQLFGHAIPKWDEHRRRCLAELGSEPDRAGLSFDAFSAECERSGVRPVVGRTVERPFFGRSRRFSKP